MSKETQLQWPRPDKNFWPNVQQILNTYFKDMDVAHFKTWQPVHLIPVYVTGNQYPEYYKDVWQYLSRLTEKDRKAWQQALAESIRGWPTEEHRMRAQLPMIVDGMYFETSSWTIKTAHHIMTFQNNIKLDIRNFDNIIEVGGGIGEFARIARGYGYKGTYQLFDLPEIQRFQKYYLELLDVDFVTEPSQLTKRKGRTLFVSTWALSEIPMSLRRQIVERVKHSDNYLIIYQGNVFGIDNNEYFNGEYQKSMQADIVAKIEIDWLKCQGGNHYLLGGTA